MTGSHPKGQTVNAELSLELSQNCHKNLLWRLKDGPKKKEAWVIAVSFFFFLQANAPSHKADKMLGVFKKLGLGLGPACQILLHQFLQP